MRDQLSDLTPLIPGAGEHVWRWFAEMDHARGSNGFGINPISFAEMDAWQRLSGEPIRQWEWRAIRRMDAIAVEMANSRAAEASRQPVEAEVSDRPMSSALFDALFVK